MTYPLVMKSSLLLKMAQSKCCEFSHEKKDKEGDVYTIVMVVYQRGT